MSALIVLDLPATSLATAAHRVLPDLVEPTPPVDLKVPPHRAGDRTVPSASRRCRQNTVPCPSPASPAALGSGLGSTTRPWSSPPGSRFRSFSPRGVTAWTTAPCPP
jgi:hypothetical protein